MIQDTLAKFGPEGVKALEEYAPNKTGKTDASIRFQVLPNQMLLIGGGYYNRRYRRIGGPTSPHVDTYKEALTKFVEELTKAVKDETVNSMKQEVLSVWK